MSGKGSSKSSGNGGGGGGGNKPSSAGGGGSSRNSEPTVVSGHQYHMYSQGSDRYAYIGKDDDGTPEFLDYGPKGGR